MTERNDRWIEAGKTAAAMAVIAGVLLLALMATALRFFKSLLL
ncbi:hypothetical protein OHA79_16815 [Streptomyces sp. NBC_00841]|nr:MULTISPECIES: hypothetical protein [unclassified Streptomyces]MCX4535342.1 hypothetical protein [Streptomyces sp. NBC_01669]WRZ99356.1 hypothetical protein OHA79_16815 [Streptomyces sp. NBC_00841]